MATQTYQTASRHLLAQAREVLYLGDARQASAQGWAAAAQMLQSAAEQRGWAHQAHTDLFNAIAGLVAETGDDDIRRLFCAAISLEANSYENWMPAVSVDSDLNDIAQFLDKLEPLAAPRWPGTDAAKQSQ